MSPTSRLVSKPAKSPGLSNTGPEVILIFTASLSVGYFVFNRRKRSPERIYKLIDDLEKKYMQLAKTKAS